MDIFPFLVFPLVVKVIVTGRTLVLFDRDILKRKVLAFYRLEKKRI